MASLTRRISSIVLASAMVVGLAAEPAFAQVTPGAPLSGPAGGTPSTTAPSNSEGSPAGGTGVVGRSRVNPTPSFGSTDGSAVAAPRATRPTAAQRRAARRRAAARRAPRPAVSDTGDASSSGLNGSNAPSR